MAQNQSFFVKTLYNTCSSLGAVIETPKLLWPAHKSRSSLIFWPIDRKLFPPPTALKLPYLLLLPCQQFSSVERFSSSSFTIIFLFFACFCPRKRLNLPKLGAEPFDLFGFRPISPSIELKVETKTMVKRSLTFFCFAVEPRHWLLFLKARTGNFCDYGSSEVTQAQSSTSNMRVRVFQPDTKQKESGCIRLTFFLFWQQAIKRKKE